MHIGLSRLARWCSGRGIEPARVSDAVLAQFIEAVREGTLHRKPNALHRNVALIWNEAAKKSRFALQRLTVPSFRPPAKRLDWSRLPNSFQNDLEAYLGWCSGSDAFAADARSRALAPQTVKLQQNHVHAALTALVESGTPPKAIRSLSDLVTIENFKRILRRRLEMVSGRENVLTATSRERSSKSPAVGSKWIHQCLKSSNDSPESSGTSAWPYNKNKTALRQFDDPDNLRRLFEFSSRLWAEVKRETNPTFRTLVKAQAAIAVGILCYMPIRPQNLWALKFDEHIFLHEGPGAISSLELSPGEVKNRTEIAFDIPTAFGEDASRVPQSHCAEGYRQAARQAIREG